MKAAAQMVTMLIIDKTNENERCHFPQVMEQATNSSARELPITVKPKFPPSRLHWDRRRADLR